MPYIVVENGTCRGQKVEITPNTEVILGRDPSADISVPDHLCSRKHFVIETKGQQVILRDLESSNGTFVNEARVKEAILANGDGIQAGDTQLTYLAETAGSGRGLVGKTVGGYRILDRVGRGGMGTVYKANQVSLNRTVALKILSHKVADDPSFVEKFQKEAQAAGRLNHPNIVQVYDVGSEGGLHFFSMEFIENGSVQDLVNRTEGPMDIDLALEIVTEAAQGLQYAEKKHLVHRDIKPDNLMVNSEGVVKIADLGLARDAKHGGEGGKPEEEEGIFGTPHFIAPEQALGKKVDSRSDIYGLGASLYLILTGETPFSGASVGEIIQKQIKEDPTPLREKRRDCPPALAQVVEKMMQKEPDDRYASASDLVAALESVSQTVTEGKKKPLALMLGALAVVALGVVGYIVFRGPKGSETDEPKVDPTPKTTDGPKTPNTTNPDAIKLNNDAYRAMTALQVADAKLAGSQRTEEALGALLTQWQDFIKKFDGTAAAKEGTAGVTKLTNELQELKTARENKEAQAQARAEVAKIKATEIMNSVTNAEASEQWAAGSLKLLEGMRAKEVRGTTWPQKFQDRLKTLLATAGSKTASDIDEAKKFTKASQFTAALELLDKRKSNLASGLNDAVELQPLRDAIEDIAKARTSVETARDAKRVQDRALDQTLGFTARRKAFELLQNSFDPLAANKLLDDALKAARTESWRTLLQRDIKTVTALEDMRLAFVNDMKASPPNPKTDKLALPSPKDPSRSVTWSVASVTDSAIQLERVRGKYKRALRFAELSPTKAANFIFELRETKNPILLRGQVVAEWVSGDPAKALQLLASSGLTFEDEQLNEALRNESKATKLLKAIRKAEADAATDPIQYLALLPKIQKFLRDFRLTIAFALNSNGETPTFGSSAQ